MVGHVTQKDLVVAMDGRVSNAVMSIYMEQMVVRIVYGITGRGEKGKWLLLTAVLDQKRFRESTCCRVLIEAELGKNNCLNAYQLIPSSVPGWL